MTHPREARVVGRGQAPDGGTWELRAGCDLPDDDSGPGCLGLYIAFQQAGGRDKGGFGCSGVGFANERRPVVLSASGSYPNGSFCYLGQTVTAATRVELDLTDATSMEAVVVPTQLPVSLWVAITGVGAVPIEIRASNGHRMLGHEPVDEDWLGPRSSAVWGPIDE